jgi:hypothetical protein
MDNTTSNERSNQSPHTPQRRKEEEKKKLPQERGLFSNEINEPNNHTLMFWQKLRTLESH